jgi:hypothetical protein
VIVAPGTYTVAAEVDYDSKAGEEVDDTTVILVR